MHLGRQVSGFLLVAYDLSFLALFMSNRLLVGLSILGETTRVFIKAGDFKMSKTALIVIDIQNDYFSDGAFTLPAMETAATKAADLIAKFRGEGAPVIHIQHIMIRPNPPFFLPGSFGEKIAAVVKPDAGEHIVTKNYPNSFRDTALAATLQGLDISNLVIVGAMTNNCVAATTRAATDFGYKVTVAHDACAAAALKFQDTTVPSDMVHTTFMAALGMQGAQVVATADVVLDKPEN